MQKTLKKLILVWNYENILITFWYLHLRESNVSLTKSLVLTRMFLNIFPLENIFYLYTYLRGFHITTTILCLIQIMHISIALSCFLVFPFDLCNEILFIAWWRKMMKTLAPSHPCLTFNYFCPIVLTDISDQPYSHLVSTFF